MNLPPDVRPELIQGLIEHLEHIDGTISKKVIISPRMNALRADHTAFIIGIYALVEALKAALRSPNITVPEGVQLKGSDMKPDDLFLAIAERMTDRGSTKKLFIQAIGIVDASKKGNDWLKANAGPEWEVIEIKKADGVFLA